MPLNSSSDNKSFETIELLPIQELLTDIAEPASIIETSDIKTPSVETRISQTPISTTQDYGVPDVWEPIAKDNDNKAITPKSETETINTFENIHTSDTTKSSDAKKSSDLWAAVREHASTNTTDIDNTYLPDVSISESELDSADNNQKFPQPSVKLSFSSFLRRNIEEEKERQETRKRKLFATWYVIITCIILLMVGSTIMKLYARITKNRDQNRVTVETYPDGDTRDYTDFEGLLTSANPDFKILFMENIKYSNKPCEINPELIIRIDEDKCTLYFRIMPYEDNIVPRITVTAYDINGNQIAENTQSLYAVGAYDIGILPITLNIPADEPGVGYTVKCNGGTMATPDTQRVIHDIRAEDDHIYVSVYGKYNLENRVYVILYKDGELVDIVSAIPGGTYTGQYRVAETDFDVSQIDFDNFEVYI